MDTPILHRRGLLFGLAGAVAAVALVGLPAPAEAQNPPQVPAGAVTGGRFGEGRQTGVPQSPRAARRRMMMRRRRRMLMRRRRMMMRRRAPSTVRRVRRSTARGMNTRSR
jgi:hypothetical protein